MKIRTLLPLLAASVAFPLASLQSETPPPAPSASGTSESQKPGNKRNPEEMAQKRLERMKESLSLNDEQMEKIAAIQKKQMPAFQAIKADTTLTKEAKLEKVKALRESMDTEINGVLTTAQQAQWKANKEKMKALREKGGDKPKPAPTN